ncbi:pyridoxamine 5'-phosphate oxidase family protein [Nocardia sp. NPDC005978]|uniref:pyridoxamine 5'-phosphate oxidase family protein n=1 Tax=unclassified Nocardia TaxID=2637762 RepID=UPI0033BF18B9
MTAKTTAFADIETQFDDYIGETVYAHMVTVDRKNRPRARVLIPVWETVDGNPVGWLATYRTPVKEAHLANNPNTTFSYWNRKQNSVHIDATADWIPLEDLTTRQHVWNLYLNTSPRGAGYPLSNFWTGIEDPKLHMLKLDPWRIQVIRGRDLRSTLWQAPAEVAVR